jgi:hypothetical protein
MKLSVKPSGRVVTRRDEKCMQNVSCGQCQSAGLSLWKTELDPWTAHVRFVVGKLTQGQGFLRTVSFPSVSFHPTNVPNTLIREVDKRLLTVTERQSRCCLNKTENWLWVGLRQIRIRFPGAARNFVCRAGDQTGSVSRIFSCSVSTGGLSRE